MTKYLYTISAVVLLLLHTQFAAQSQPRTSGDGLEQGLIDAVALYNGGRYQEALAVLGKLQASFGQDDAVCYYMGLCEAASGDAEKAEQHLRLASELDPGNFWYRYRLAALYAMTDRSELTEVIYEDLLKDFPKRSELYYDLVDLYMGRNQMDKALETLGKIETEFGKNEATAMTRFNLLRRMDREREAYESLEAFNREYSSPQVLTVLGDYQMSMYNDSTALALYDEALDIDSEYAPAMLGKAEAFRITRRYPEYFRALGRFVCDDDISPLGKSEYLKAVAQRSDPKFLSIFRPQMDSVVNACVSVHPNDSSVLAMAGIYYFGTDRKDESQQFFRRNMETWPQSISAAANYVEVLMYSHDWETLAEEGRKAFEKFPEEIAFLEMASLADYNLGDYDKVIETCRTIVGLPGADSTKVLNSYATMGDVYHMIGDNAKAYKAYDKALKLNPEHLPVLNNYAYFLSMEGRRLKKAYSMSRIAIEKEPDNATYLDTFAWILYLMGRPQEAKPYFKHAMLYGGKDSPVIMDHYAEVLYALGEYDLAFVYWTQASDKNNGQIAGLEERIRERKASMKK